MIAMRNLGEYEKLVVIRRHSIGAELADRRSRAGAQLHPPLAEQQGDALHHAG